jgi:hypothetical protein
VTAPVPGATRGGSPRPGRRFNSLDVLVGLCAAGSILLMDRWFWSALARRLVRQAEDFLARTRANTKPTPEPIPDEPAEPAES